MIVFTACNTARVFAYLPQIMKISRDTQGAAAISYTTWTLFGASNQLLAALTLLSITVWLSNAKQRFGFTLFPMAFVLVMTLWSLGKLTLVNFSKANFEPFAYVATTANANYEDEAVFFTDDDRITNSFRRRFDDRWVNTSVFRNYANINGPVTRSYPLYAIDPSMSFSADYDDFTARWISRMDLEKVGVDAIVFRVMENRAADAVIRAVGRGVPVRLISEPQEYRNPKRLKDARDIDRMYMAGAQIRMRQHAGLTHEGLILLRGLGELGWIAPSLATHALTVGAAGGLIIGMMTRTARGHTGRPLRADRFETLCYAFVLLAAVVRVALPLVAPDLTLAAILGSAALWSAGFGLYAIRYAPLLTRPRADGQPG